MSDLLKRLDTEIDFVAEHGGCHADFALVTTIAEHVRKLETALSRIMSADGVLKGPEPYLTKYQMIKIAEDALKE